MMRKQILQGTSVCVVVGLSWVLLAACAHDGSAHVAAPSRPPFVTTVSPASGAVGTEVVVTGGGFTASTNTLKFGPGYINGLASGDGTSLHFTVPEGHNLCGPTSGPCAGGAYPRVTSGSYSVLVLNENGTSNSVTFTVREQ